MDAKTSQPPHKFLKWTLRWTMQPEKRLIHFAFTRTKRAHVTEVAWCGDALWKESYPQAQRGKTHKAWHTQRERFPQTKHDTHSAWVSSACRSPARLTMVVQHLQQHHAEICSFSEALLDLRRTAAGDRPNPQAGHCKRSNPAAEAFQRRISASAKSHRGRVFVAEEIWDPAVTQPLI